MNSIFVLSFALLACNAAALRLPHQSGPAHSSHGKSIPHTVFVTGEWEANSSELSTVHSNIKMAEVNFKQHTMSMQARVEEQLAKWMPLGSTIKYFSTKDMEESARSISKMLKDRGVTDHAFEAYSNLRPGAFRADLWRYMILWAEGGVYLDANLQLNEKLEKWVDFDKDELVLIEDGGCSAETPGARKPYGGYWNAMMAAAPQNVYLEGVIKTVVENIKSHYYGADPLDITGPRALYQALQKQGPEYLDHLRCDLKWRFDLQKVTPKNAWHMMFARKDEHLHHRYTEGVHYNSMYIKHQVYCDEPGPTPHAGLCAE